MLDQNPHIITEAKWQEISHSPVVRDAWGLDDEVDPLEFASCVYGAKFNFRSGSPGYVGDLYILQGDALTEVRPIVLRRDNKGTLIVC